MGSEDINDVRLLVFKRNADGLLHPEPLFLDHRGTVNPHLDKSKMTKILIHGWKTALEYAERFIHGTQTEIIPTLMLVNPDLSRLLGSR